MDVGEDLVLSNAVTGLLWTLSVFW